MVADVAVEAAVQFVHADHHAIVLGARGMAGAGTQVGVGVEQHLERQRQSGVASPHGEDGGEQAAGAVAADSQRLT